MTDELTSFGSRVPSPAGRRYRSDLAYITINSILTGASWSL